MALGSWNEGGLQLRGAESLGVAFPEGIWEPSPHRKAVFFEAQEKLAE